MEETTQRNILYLMSFCINYTAPRVSRSTAMYLAWMSAHKHLKALMGTTAKKGIRGSLVRMTPDVVYYSWAAFDTSIWRYLNRHELNFSWKGLFWCKVSLYRAYILEKSSLDEMKGICRPATQLKWKIWIWSTKNRDLGGKIGIMVQ